MCFNIGIMWQIKVCGEEGVFISSLFQLTSFSLEVSTVISFLCFFLKTIYSQTSMYLLIIRNVELHQQAGVPVIMRYI